MIGDDFSGYLDAVTQYGTQFDVVDPSETRPPGVKVADVRRRRGRLTDSRETGVQNLALVEREGVLLWLPAEDVGSPRYGGLRRRARRRGLAGLEVGRVVKEVSVPVLEPNQYLSALADTDQRLNAQCDAGLRTVKVAPDGQSFAATTEGLKASYSKRTLLIVHGTFSSSANILGELAATPKGRAFMHDALKAYGGQVLVFDHPTLSVSPFLNALDLGRRLAGTTGSLDVIAHSRGGLVTQWWLEVFGDALAGAQVRAVLAGAPLRGTHLASPARIQPFLSVLSNIGHYVGQTLNLAASANPFALASLALLRFLGQRERNRWGLPPIDGIGSRPGTDAAVAVIPGLQGQSAVGNNAELMRLRASTARANVRYYACVADFEPERIGWKLWKVISEFGDRAKDVATDAIFKGANDLVVDTAHMTTLADGRDITEVTQFLGQAVVHHCNYFRQNETLKSLRDWFKPLT